MLEPLNWMFRIENFKEHFKYLFKINVIIFTSLVIMAFCYHLIENFNPLLSISLCILLIILLTVPFFVFQGYFWELTECVINRHIDIIASSIYDGKTGEVYTISLPEISTPKFIWRGIASIVATMLLIYPLAILFGFSMFNANSAAEFLNFDFSGLIITYGIAFILIGLFIPALLWNYAKRNSVFAVWNIPCAIHVMGTYTGRYFLNTILFLAVAFLNYFITKILLFILGLNNVVLNASSDLFTVIRVLVFFFISYTIYIYWIYVNAYLLGTIAPRDEI